MKTLRNLILTVAVVLGGWTTAHADFSLSVGTDNFYLSVGNYDYLPYAGGNFQPRTRISFYDVMSDYGNWVNVSPFGQVWRPYASYGWRPYVYGHWIYTQYGPTWQGYEPWAWVGYHYGDWVFSQQAGWVWIPGYDWHPGHVVWSQGYDTIGWMPAPPNGYGYDDGGYFRRYDSNSGYGNNYYGNNGYDYNGYGGYVPNSVNVNINLWVFINNNHFGYDNYADYCLDRNYTRDLFDRRVVKVATQRMDRARLESITRQRIDEVGVDVRELRTDNRQIKMIVPRGQEQLIRKNANKVVNQVIAPAFAEKQKQFRGLNAQNRGGLSQVFNQDDRKPNIEKVSAEKVISNARTINNQREETRVKVSREVIEKTDRAVKENKIQPTELNPTNKKTATTQKQVRSTQIDNQSKSKQIQNDQRDEQFQQQHNQQIQNDQIKKEQLQKDQLKAEQSRQEQIRNDQSRNEQLKNQQINNDRIRNEQAVKEQSQKDQQKADQLRQQQLRNEQFQNEQIRNEQMRKQQLQNEQLKNQQTRDDQNPRNKSTVNPYQPRYTPAPQDRDIENSRERDKATTDNVDKTVRTDKETIERTQTRDAQVVQDDDSSNDTKQKEADLSKSKNKNSKDKDKNKKPPHF